MYKHINDDAGKDDLQRGIENFAKIGPTSGNLH